MKEKENDKMRQGESQKRRKKGRDTCCYSLKVSKQ